MLYAKALTDSTIPLNLHRLLHNRLPVIPSYSKSLSSKQSKIVPDLQTVFDHLAMNLNLFHKCSTYSSLQKSSSIPTSEASKYVINNKLTFHLASSTKPIGRLRHRFFRQRDRPKSPRHIPLSHNQTLDRQRRRSQSRPE